MTDDELRLHFTKMEDALERVAHDAHALEERLEGYASTLKRLGGRVEALEKNHELTGQSLVHVREEAAVATRRALDSLHEVRQLTASVTAHLARAEQARTAATVTAINERQAAQRAHAQRFEAIEDTVKAMQLELAALRARVEHQGVKVQWTGRQKLAALGLVLSIVVPACVQTSQALISAKYPHVDQAPRRDVSADAGADATTETTR